MKGYNIQVEDSIWKDFRIKCINENVSVKSKLRELIKGYTYTPVKK